MPLLEEAHRKRVSTFWTSGGLRTLESWGEESGVVECISRRARESGREPGLLLSCGDKSLSVSQGPTRKPGTLRAVQVEKG